MKAKKSYQRKKRKLAYNMKGGGGVEHIFKIYCAGGVIGRRHPEAWMQCEMTEDINEAIRGSEEEEKRRRGSRRRRKYRMHLAFSSENEADNWTLTYWYFL